MGDAGLLRDPRALMLFDAHKKNIFVAYLLWVFLGVFGAHSSYLARPRRVAIGQLTLGLLSMVGTLGLGGAFLSKNIYTIISISVVWLVVDAFLIPGWIRTQNNRLATSLGAIGVPAN